MKNIIKSLLMTAMLLTSTIAGVNAANTAKAADPRDGKVTHLTKEMFDKQICNTNGAWKYLGDKPCVIDFYATWCGPCKMITPFLEEFADKYKGQLYIYKVDVDQQRELAQMFGASSIPLLIFVPMKGEPSAQRGALPHDDLEKAIRTAVLGLPQ